MTAAPKPTKLHELDRVGELVSEGDGWVVRKEFYADGPSLFVWIAERPGERHEFRLWRDAMAFVRANCE
jgi:hypothetical protein